MTDSEIQNYNEIRLLDIRADVPEEWNVRGSTHLRVTLPTSVAAEGEMERRGFHFADRTLRATIDTKAVQTDLERLIRMKIVETDRGNEDVLRIAKESFPYDRRFHILPECDDNIAEKILEKWVAELDDVLICLYHDKPIGFLALKRIDDEELCVHLAAVEEKYRMTGGALSLYAAAVSAARSRKCRRLFGRISSQNVAVMNLYAFFGARFSEPLDIFLKETSE